jgi:enamine deaminase RidA (YjgF/YER057c/UK114 family)
MTGVVVERLSLLGITLPAPPAPAANYAPFVREGRLVQVAAVASARLDGTIVVGKVGRELTIEDGYEAARLCALYLLAVLNEACGGDLQRVRQLMTLRGFVNATEAFERIPRVLDGASDLLVDVFGPTIGRHARTAIGCASLPSRVAVELDLLAVVDADERG